MELDKNKNPVTEEDVKNLLGHKNTTNTDSYLQEVQKTETERETEVSKSVTVEDVKDVLGHKEVKK